MLSFLALINLYLNIKRDKNCKVLYQMDNHLAYLQFQGFLRTPELMAPLVQPSAHWNTVCTEIYQIVCWLWHNVRI